MKITRKDKQIWEELSIDQGLSRWSKIFEESSNEILFLSPNWIKTYIDDPNIKMIIISKGGLDIAAMLIEKNGNFIFKMKLGGPLIKKNIQELKPCKVLSYEKAIFENFAEIIIRRTNNYVASWHYDIKYWYPMKWKGFNQTTRYHFITKIKDKKKCWDNLETKIRTDIRKAAKNKLYIKEETIDDFLSLYKKTNPRNFKEIYKFYKTLSTNLKCEIRTTYLKKEALSSIFFIEFKDTIYYIDSYKNSNKKFYGSQSFNIWNLIENSNATYFNFLGSSIPAVEKYFRGFGGDPKPHSVIYRTNIYFRLLFKIKKIFTN